MMVEFIVKKEKIDGDKKIQHWSDGRKIEFIVRCKDCKFSFVEETMFGYSIIKCSKQITVDRQYHSVDDNHYCQQGERKTDE